MNEVVLRPFAPAQDGDLVRVSAVATLPDRGELPLWVTLPSERAGEVRDDADPWVLALLHAAMVRGVPLRVDGVVSESLLAHLEEYQSAVAAWSSRPRWPGSPVYRHIEVRADEVSEQPRPNRDVVCSFSGGIDSAFTLQRHVRGSAGNATRSIRTALMVGGFDIPVGDTAVFDSAVARARTITDDLGLPLEVAATNLRDLDLLWPDVFPGAVVAVLCLLGGAHGVGMLSTGRRWDWLDLADDGSSPAWDWALGSDSFEVVHDGAGFDRPDKVAALRDWDAARRNVRFCWAGAHLDRNCGRCRKCVGTYLLFRSLGVAPDCFDEVPPDDELAGLVALRRPGWSVSCRYAESLLATARAHDVREPWVAALERELFKGRRLDSFERARSVAENLRDRAEAALSARRPG